MGSAGVNGADALLSSMELLQKQSLKVDFHLQHTDYVKVENIGTGAYGVVCSAIHKKTRQKVAIKKIPNIFTLDPRYAIRTYREIKILQHFKHGNVIAIREILKPSDKDISDVYVVMDLMESDLHRIIYSKQTLTDEHVKYFLYQILRGLKYVHSANVIHRDLKPSNLLVNANCELKIGDFGMARGVNGKADKTNAQLTMYVATRWYRAPELIMSHKDYGASIDTWSVGCILAEMLRRKHLFPGTDMLNQLTLIIGTLGKPAQKYIDDLDSQVVAGFIQKMKSERKTCAELCPKACPEAVQLLSRMLVIDPKDRISVDEALAHPYLAKYHDPSDEPVCPVMFDFSFEQNLTNAQSDDAKRVQLKELLMKEVLDYQKPKQKPIDFGSLISAKSDLSPSQDQDNPYADLNAFLMQLASPIQRKPSPSSASDGHPVESEPTTNQINPLLTNAGPRHPLLNNPLLTGATTRNPLLMGGTAVNPLLASSAAKNPLLLGGPSVNPLLASSSLTNPLLGGLSKPPASTSVMQPSTTSIAKMNPLLAVASLTNQLQVNKYSLGGVLSDSQQTDISKQNPSNAFCGNPVLCNTSDTEELKPREAEVDAHLSVADSGNMLSVGNESRSITRHETSETAVSNPQSESENSNDSGGYLSRVSELDNSNTLFVNIKCKPSNEEIEMLSAKLEQSKIDETSNRELGQIQPEPHQLLDMKALVRQRIIASRQQRRSSSSSLPEKANGKVPVTAYQRQKEREEKRKQKKLKAKQKKQKPETVASQLLTSEDQKMLERWRQMAKPQAIQPKPAVDADRQPTTAVSSHQGNQVIVVYPPNTYSFVTTIPLAPSTLTHSSMLSHTQSVPTTTTTGSIVTDRPMQDVNHVIQRPQHFHTSEPIGGFGDHVFHTSNLHQSQSRMYSFESNQDTCFYETDFESHSFGRMRPTSNTVHDSMLPQFSLGASNLNNWSNDINLDGNLDVPALSRSFSKQLQDGPLVLISTPKGTGGGYGVGLDMISPLAEQYQAYMHSVHMDSAPLSASLIADWMDVTANMDPKDLEDIQHELELSSAIHDFPFNSYE